MWIFSQKHPLDNLHASVNYRARKFEWQKVKADKRRRTRVAVVWRRQRAAVRRHRRHRVCRVWCTCAASVMARMRSNRKIPFAAVSVAIVFSTRSERVNSWCTTRDERRRIGWSLAYTMLPILLPSNVFAMKCYSRKHNISPALAEFSVCWLVGALFQPITRH